MSGNVRGRLVARIAAGSPCAIALLNVVVYLRPPSPGCKRKFKVLFGRSAKPLLGLDITTSSVKLIELSKSGENYRVEAFAAEATPINAVNEKAIVDAQVVGDAVRRAVKRSGARSRDAAVAISGDAAITKTIQLPASFNENELEGQVALQADQYIPFPMEEVSYDFEVIGPNEADPEMLDILLVATRTENVEQRQAAVEAAGLKAVLVDVEAFAVENACMLLRHQMPEEGIGHNIAVIDFGASSTTFSVLRDLKVRYTRDFAFGGQQLTEEIMRTYGLTLEEAGRAKKEGGLPSNYEPEILEPFIDDMTQQVSRSLQFFLASGTNREQPEQILVCGGCANIPGVADVISSRVGIPTQVGNPLGMMKISSKARSQGVMKDATALLTACGLALRSFD
ncbi:pilus assembly protein PilM [Thioalkalivibrio sp. XN279]|nr:pilus assembly protein PilM [Thioalkalivibrio sp. XN279]